MLLSIASSEEAALKNTFGRELAIAYRFQRRVSTMDGSGGRTVVESISVKKSYYRKGSCLLTLFSLMQSRCLLLWIQRHHTSFILTGTGWPPPAEMISRQIETLGGRPSARS